MRHQRWGGTQIAWCVRRFRQKLFAAQGLMSDLRHAVCTRKPVRTDACGSSPSQAPKPGIRVRQFEFRHCRFKGTACVTFHVIQVWAGTGNLHFDILADGFLPIKTCGASIFLSCPANNLAAEVKNSGLRNVLRLSADIQRVATSSPFQSRQLKRPITFAA